MKILVTGGCGFIGSNFIKYVLEQQDFKQVVNVDKRTYAAGGNNLEHMGIKEMLHRDYTVDIADREAVDDIFDLEKPDFVVNFAAESHVDRSIAGSEDFIASNVVGAANMLDAAMRTGVKRFVQISTDEVYGSREKGSFSETDALSPSSPYSSSKASADLVALSYFKTHGFPVSVTRSTNNYGPYQFPEKLIPLFITNLIEGKRVPLMWTPDNPGLNVRDWLHVNDNCRAIYTVLLQGKPGEVYNVPGENERTNTDIAGMLLKAFGLAEDMIERVAHRKGHDFRYSIYGTKLRSLGFSYAHKDFESELSNLVEWHKANQGWWRPLKK